MNRKITTERLDAFSELNRRRSDQYKIQAFDFNKNITTVCLVTIRIEMSKYTIDIPFKFHVFYLVFRTL